MTLASSIDTLTL